MYFTSLEVTKDGTTYTIPQPLLSLRSNDSIFALRITLRNQRAAEVLAKILNNGTALCNDYRLFGSRCKHFDHGSLPQRVNVFQLFRCHPVCSALVDLQLILNFELL
jgi:hypothetical protein